MPARKTYPASDRRASIRARKGRSDTLTAHRISPESDPASLPIALVVAGAIFLGLQIPATGHADDTIIEPSVERGRALVTENCSGCHAVGQDGESPHSQAPAFRNLGERFPIDALEETFIESIDTGHPGMPVFLASPTQIADIIEYIATVMGD